MAPRTKKRVAKKKPRKSKAKALPGEVVGEINGFPIRRVQVGAITGADYNPRTITEAALEGLKHSTQEFGLVQAIVWNKRTQKVVGGHQRLKTLDPDEHTDVVEVDLDDDREKALNLALNSGHIAGEFTTGLAEILAELEVNVPDLAENLHFGELYVDVPTEVDDLLVDDRGVERGGNEGAASNTKSVTEKQEGWEASDLRQIILILSTEEHSEATTTLDEVMKGESCESYTAAVLWLLRNYEK